MSETDLLRLHRGPLARDHAGRNRQKRGIWDRSNRLYGLRGLYKPTMSALSIQRLGDVRHALAQRCIAGTLEVHAPFATPISEEAQKVLKGKTIAD